MARLLVLVQWYAWQLASSHVEEILQKFRAFQGEEGFGVELDAVEGPGFVPHAHDLIFSRPRGDFEIGREGAGADDERVVAGGLEGVGEAGEDALAIVVDGRGFAVHESPVAFDGAAVGEADALVA